MRNGPDRQRWARARRGAAGAIGRQVAREIGGPVVIVWDQIKSLLGGLGRVAKTRLARRVLESKIDRLGWIVLKGTMVALVPAFIRWALRWLGKVSAGFAVIAFAIGGLTLVMGIAAIGQAAKEQEEAQASGDGGPAS